MLHFQRSSNITSITAIFSSSCNGSATTLKKVVSTMLCMCLSYLGHSFKTWSQSNFNSIWYQNYKQAVTIFFIIIERGTPIGSDHIPTIIKFQVQHFKITHTQKSASNKLNIDLYKSKLCSINFGSLDGQPVEENNNLYNAINNNIITATSKCCPTSSSKQI